MARDCTVKSDPNAPPGAPQANRGNFDSEYASLMAELGETAGPGSGKAWGGGGAGITGGGSDIPPWRRPEMWQTTTPGANQNANGQNGYRPPQAFGGSGSGYGAGYGTQSSWYQGSYPQGYSGQDYSTAYAQYYQQQYNQAQTAVPQQ